MSISDALGEQREVKLRQGTVRYRERGQGEPIVFVHGLLVNGDLWRKVVPRLADRYRCITPDWPLGAHSEPLAADADLTPAGLGRLIADFLEALDLDGVTLVGNDTGTALTQIATAAHPDRIARIVLTTGDAFKNFPPTMFKGVIGLGYLPGSLWLLDKAARPTAARRASLAPLAKTLRDPAIFESYAGQVKHHGIRRDLAKVLRSLRSRYTVEAAEKLRSFKGRALIVWAPEDRFFPNEHADQLAELLPDARVVLIRDSFAFVSEDQPERTADAIAEFMAERPVGAGAASG
jgi:pimeloyl-ACP methyl ester carboxylesterase